MSTSPNTRSPRRGRPPSGVREAVLAAALHLVRERGAARLTTREVATLAGVSEGSVFYHFGDRVGLLAAVIEDAVGQVDLTDPAGTPPSAVPRDDLAQALTHRTEALERFLDKALVAMVAAQSDTALRDGLVAHLADRDLGPHQGISILTAFVRDEQEAGRIRTDVEPQTLAFLVYSAAFTRAGLRRLIGDPPDHASPAADALAAALATLLAPEGPGVSPAARAPRAG